MASDTTSTGYVSSGTLQQKRLSHSLVNNLKIDDGTVYDFLAYVAEFSKYIRYYNDQNNIDGTWEDFFLYEYPFALASVLSVPMKEETTNLQTLGSYLEGKNKVSAEDRNIAAQLVFSAIFDIAHRIDGWYLLFLQHEGNLAFYNELSSAIENYLKLNFPKLKKLETELFGSFYDTDTGGHFKDFSPIWGIKAAPVPRRRPRHPDEIIEFYPHNVSDPETDDVHNNYLQLAEILWSFLKTQSYILAKARQELEAYLSTNEPFKPHSAALMAYWQMYLKTQALLNGYTKKHLHFYYYDFLQLKKLPASPDSSFVYFQLQKNINAALVPCGTMLDGGKDSSGQPIVFLTNNELAVNTAQVVKLMSLFVSKQFRYPNHDDQYLISDLLIDTASPADITAAPNGWAPFGNDESQKLQTMARGTVGFAIAAPILLLNEGNRTITIDLVTDATSVKNITRLFTGMYGPGTNINDQFSNWLQMAFVIYGSGVKDWVKLQIASISYSNSDSKISIVLNIGIDGPGIVNYSKALPGDSITTSFPVIKISLNNDNPRFSYSVLQMFNISSINLSVNVQGLSSLAISNSGGKVDATKPFQPFGQVPVLGSYFSLWNQELAQKKSISHLSFNIEWFNLPPDGFAVYYENYFVGQSTIKETRLSAVTNNSFTVNIAKAGSGNFVQSGPGKTTDFCLFQSTNTANMPPVTLPDGKLLPYSTLTCNTASITSDVIFIEDTALNFDKTNTTDLYTISLSGPTYAFLNEFYLQAMNTAMLANASKLIAAAKTPATTNTSPATGGKGSVQTVKPSTPEQTHTTVFSPVPNIPFVPVIKSINVDYAATQAINMLSNNKANDQFQLFYLDAFSQYQAFPFAPGITPVTVPMLPQYTKQCYFHIGFEQLALPQNVTMLVEVILKPAINPGAVPVITWEYLSAGGWVALTGQHSPVDGSSNFSKTGIIQFKLTTNMVADNPMMPLGQYWIRGSVDAYSPLIANIRNIQTQAVAVTRSVETTVKETTVDLLPPNTIAGFIKPIPQIKAVVQPNTTYGGADAENDQAYYTRVSERLNHKQRAVTSFDYEHILLQQYPELYFVRCLNHTVVNSTEKSPGNVLIVVIPSTADKNFSVDPLAPRLPYGQLNDMKAYIQGFASPFANINIINPQYVFLTINCGLTLNDGLDPGIYLARLSTDLCSYLTPWASSSDTYSINGKLTGFNVISFIEKCAYVKQIDMSTFWIDLSIETTNGQYTTTNPKWITQDNLSNNIIAGNKPWNIIAPRKKHNLQLSDGTA